MSDMRATIMPKTDQLNADHFIGGPRTIKITGVVVGSGKEQPVSISFENDGGKIWKPCLSMRRVLVRAWGHDSKNYVGKSVTLYCDPKVTWAGAEVGGIRISHLSHITEPLTMALTASKSARKSFTVKPLIATTTEETKP